MKQEDKEKNDFNEILKNITSMQAKQRYIEMQIENIIRYYNPKYSTTLQDHLDLKQQLKKNEQLIKSKSMNA